jgi:diguanylate cyclase (GGDEF)-like protein/putative nucleotidyltransferase with HDIG domain
VTAVSEPTHESAGRHGCEQPAAPVPRRLLAYVALVSAGGAMLVTLGAVTIARAGLTAAGWASLAALLTAAVFVEAFPVPIKGVRAGGISLAAVFIVATGCLYGWGAAAVLGAITRASVELVQRRPWTKVSYNSSVYAISGAVAGVIASYGTAHTEHVTWFASQVIASAATFYVLNVVLVALVVSISVGKNLGTVVAQTVESTVVAFATMASVAIMLCVLWDRSPLLAATLVGPFLAIALYQRSVLRELEAIELALTDPISGLGNHRHFQQELERLLDEVDETGTPLTLCLLDVDEFKWINDSHGHPVGDRILALVGANLRDAGAAFRLGGDEFALFFTNATEEEAVETASSAVDRIARERPEGDFAIAVSAGLATYPSPGLERADLVRAADCALYLAKAEGRAAVRVFRPGVVDLSARRGSEEADRRARLRAAASLAGAIDVRDAYTGSHSQAVGELAARIGEQLELPAEEVELLRIAGLLHDLGKVAVPEHILSKPGPLTQSEHDAIAMHPLVGYRMLTSLRIEPVATWVLHHHERWDGHGYPDGLAGEKIPIGSRVLLVADAYEAMTTDRLYRTTRSRSDALDEIARCAGSQFDPRVVDALLALVEAGAVTPSGVMLAS